VHVDLNEGIYEDEGERRKQVHEKYLSSDYPALFVQWEDEFKRGDWSFE
jgi:hypothetical protein